MSQLNIIVAIAAVAVVLLGLVSTRIDRGPLSVPLLALVVGVVTGEVGLGWIAFESWPRAETILKEAARFTLAISVMGIAMRTPLPSYRRLARPVLTLLTLGMIAIWAVSSGLAWGVLGFRRSSRSHSALR